MTTLFADTADDPSCTSCAVDEVTGSGGYARYADQASQTAQTVADSDSVVLAIVAKITSAWEGSASELQRLLTVDKPPKDWPSTPQGMGGRLIRAALPRPGANTMTTLLADLDPSCSRCGAEAGACGIKRWLSGRPCCVGCQHSGEPPS